MADEIETVDELRRVVREKVRNRRLDIRRLDILRDTQFLRDTLRVGDAVPSFEMHRIVTETLRSDRNPEVVFTLSGGLVVA